MSKCWDAACVPSLRAIELEIRGLNKSKAPGIDEYGVAVPRYKMKGPQEDCASYRSVLLENHSVKIWHRLQGVERSVLDTQVGGLRGRSADIAAHAVQALLAFSTARNVPMAILFADLRAAYYSVFRGSLDRFNGSGCALGSMVEQC